MGQAEGNQVPSKLKLEEATQREPLQRELRTPSQWEKLPLEAGHPPAVRTCGRVVCDPALCDPKGRGSD